MLASLAPKELTAYLTGVELRAFTPKTIVQEATLTVELDRVRRQGYAFVDEELEIGLRSLAVPVRTRSGRVVAAMNSGVHAARVRPKEMLTRFLPVLQQGPSASAWRSVSSLTSIARSSY